MIIRLVDRIVMIEILEDGEDPAVEHVVETKADMILHRMERVTLEILVTTNGDHDTTVEVAIAVARPAETEEVSAKADSVMIKAKMDTVAATQQGRPMDGDTNESLPRLQWIHPDLQLSPI